MCRSIRSQTRQSTWPMTALQGAGWSTAVKIAATHDAAPDNSQSAPQTPADWQHPACCSRWPPALTQHRASGYWQSPLAREHRCNVQTTLPANRAQQHIDLSDSHHERLGRLNGLRVGRWHLQSQACSAQLDPFAGTGQHPIVADSFYPCWQDMQVLGGQVLY